MRKLIVPVCLLPVAFQLFLIVNSVYAYAHTHSNQSLTREEKSLPSLYWQKPEGKGKKECMRWVLSLLNEHLKENKRPQRYALKNGNLVVGMENN